MGSFEEDYLSIPSEIIRLTIKTNQKCFVTRKQGEDTLSNRFILVSNIQAHDGGKEIVHGNGKVVRARLSDALHFWKRDQGNLPDLETLAASAAKFGLDLKKPLDQRMAKLDALDVTFHAKLGTQGARVARVRALAKELAAVTGADTALTDRAAVLAKADLRTEAVGEFPELQGLMGRKYAVLQGENASVAAAVEDHYKPQGPSDRVPEDKVAITLALADKLDTLTGFWAIDEKPTGSKDPFALRRAALGVVRILLERRVRLPLLATTRDGDLLSFFHDRLKVYLRDQGARHDLIDAVLTPDADDLLMVARRVEALTAFITSEDGKNLLAGTKRATQLLAAEEKERAPVIADGVSPALLKTRRRERKLFAAISSASKGCGEMPWPGEDFPFGDGKLSPSCAARSTASSKRCWSTTKTPPSRANRLALLRLIPRSDGNGCGFLEDFGLKAGFRLGVLT